jgi:hypothetical protein
MVLATVLGFQSWLCMLIIDHPLDFVAKEKKKANCGAILTLIGIQNIKFFSRNPTYLTLQE